MRTEQKMTELDEHLLQALRKRQELGVVDIKCHVDVTATTEPRDLKRALLNVFDQDNDGEIERVPLRDLKSFDELCERIR